MKHTLFLAAIIAFSFRTAAQTPHTSSSIDSQITSIMSAQHLPGVSAVIVKGGEIVWMNSYGFAHTGLQTPFTDTTSLMLASVSKVFTGIALMQLHEAGMFSLDDDINDYLPFAFSIPGYETQPVTFRMLLTHTASINDGDAMDDYYNWNGDPTISLADCMERYFSTAGIDYDATDNFLNNPPGTVFQYSNMSTALEGHLVEVISGMPFHQYCNQNIFSPLCMKNTHWYLNEYPALSYLANPHDYFSAQYEPIPHYGFADYPDGMLHSNARDLANFMIAVLQGGIFHDDTLLSASTLDSMFTAQIPSVEPTQGLQFYQETFNPSVGNVTLWGHSGGEYGISTELYFNLNGDMGIAVLANGDNDIVEIFELLYNYGLTLSPTGTGNPGCSFTSAADSRGLQDTPRFRVYPNPASTTVSFETENRNHVQHEIIISDVTGRKLIQTQLGESKTEVDISRLPEGFYYYILRHNNKMLQTGKLIVSN